MGATRLVAVLTCLLGCACDERPVRENVDVRARQAAACASAAEIVKARYEASREHFDERAWNALASRFDGTSAKTLLEVATALKRSQAPKAQADNLLRAAAEPHNQGGKPNDVAGEIAALRKEAGTGLAATDTKIHDFIARLRASSDPACERVVAPEPK